MKLKLSIVNLIVGLLSGMKLNKVADKDIKTTLINDYIYLRRLVKQPREDKDEMASKFQSDWRDDFVAVESLRREKKPVVGYDKYLLAEADANKAISDLFSVEVEVLVKSVPMNDFLAVLDGEEMNLEQIALLQEAGVIE